jgi:hypothetical protein
MLDGAAFIKQVTEKCWNEPFISLSPVTSNRAKRAAVRKQIEERRQERKFVDGIGVFSVLISPRLHAFYLQVPA